MLIVHVSLGFSLDLSKDSTNFAIDHRIGSPLWINNLDSDSQYRNWGNSVKMMVQPYFPGIACVDPILRGDGLVASSSKLEALYGASLRG